MIEAITAAGLEPAQAANGASAANQPQASRHEIRDFAAAMERNSGPQAAQQPTAVEAAQAPAPTSKAAQALLTAFDNINGGANSIREIANRLGASSTEFTPSQVIQLTVECHEFMFKTQLTSNVANRTSDGIQQLFRQQS